MYEKIAWNNFENTGNIESYLEYKKIIQLKDENLKRNIDGKMDENIDQEVNESINSNNLSDI